MRKLILAVAVLALVFCGWWAFAGFGLKQGVASWFEDRRAEGWQADVADLHLAGFPGWVSTELRDVAVADPAAGLAFGMSDLTLAFRTLWPGDMQVALPNGPLDVATPEGTWRVLAQNGLAVLNLHPGTALELERMALNTDAFILEQADGASVLGGAGLTLSMTQGTPAAQYVLEFDVTDFAPGDVPRSAVLLPNDWPLIFEVLQAEAQILFDRPVDRATLEDSRAQPQRVDLRLAEARWGSMRLFATGEMIRDARGYADGSLTIKAENWEQMLDLAQNAGILPPERRPLVTRVLQGLAGNTGVTSDLDVTLTFENGQTRLGFIPLGPAPSMILR